MKWTHEVSINITVQDTTRLALFELILQQGELPNRRNKVEIIKFVRDQVRYTDGQPLTLKAAKDIVDEIEWRLCNWCSPLT